MAANEAETTLMSRMTDRQVRIMALVLVATGLAPINLPTDPVKFRAVLKRRSTIMACAVFVFAIIALYFG